MPARTAKSDNTTKQGNRFRDDVAFLLRLANYNPDVEVHIEHKRVDIYFEAHQFGDVHRVACECKNEKSPLTMEYINRIYSDYLGLIQKGRIDRILIVSPLDIGPAAKAYVRDHRDLSFQTYAELERDLMDFSNYLRSVTAQFGNDGLSEYYIPPVLDDAQDVEEVILDWIQSQVFAPVAILAGYGMGKTSFASRIAYVAGQAAKTDSSSRIPILVRLGDISAEQDLEGLFGRVLSANHVVRNYNFNLFLELNRRGKFLVILDGFDEMKHTMSWDQFRYNFYQINRLIDGQSKVLLMGRPSAFLSDAEYNFVLRGIRDLHGQEYKDPEWPEYTRLRLRMFDEQQAHTFVERYVAYREHQDAGRTGRAVDPAFVQRRTEEIASDEFRELIARPVQAKMLADIAASRKIVIRRFSRYELYDTFINLINERETGKHTRRYFNTHERRAFAREIAWWLWSTSGLSGFNAEEIPDQIILAFRKHSHDQVDDLRRDLVSACFLDHKLGDKLYFPHRSFQEFLVAEYILTWQWQPSQFETVSSNLNPEIVKFVQERNKTDTLVSWYSLLPQATGRLSLTFLSLIAWALKVEGHDHSKSSVPPSGWQVVVIFLMLLGEKPTNETIKSSIDYIIRLFNKPPSLIVQLASIVCWLLAIEAADTLDKKRWDIMRRRLILDIISKLDLKTIVEQNRRRSRLVTEAGRNNPLMDCFLNAFSGERIQNSGQIRVHVDVAELVKTLGQHLAPSVKIDDIKPALSSLKWSYASSEFQRVKKEDNDYAKMWEFFSVVPNPTKITKVETQLAVARSL